MTATVTFLLTDIEGSSRLWNDDEPVMRAAIAIHDEVVTRCVQANGGDVLTERGEGDSFFAVFPRAGDAVAAAVDLQRDLERRTWPGGITMRVRAAIHSGAAGLPDYRGPTANRTARYRACAHGGQVLLSSATAQMAGTLPPGASLLDLGEHRLRDMSGPQRIFQLQVEGVTRVFPPIRSLGAFSHNLPVQPTSFVGRAKEAEAIQELLAEHRLVTLTGTGGCGKSRLALQLAADQADEYPGGVWFVGLAGLTEPDLLPQHVASVLGVREEPGRPLLDTLAAKLREKPVLLLLDNCEHLVGSCGDLAARLLATCPELRVLVTSREILNVHGERAWRIPPLGLPDRERARNPRQVIRSEAVELFLDRAARARPGYAMDAGNADTIARICVRLEGIPLAIEIAAARLRTASAVEIEERLDDRFRVLTGGSRSGPSPYQTLRAAIDWSYDLLDAAERTLFQRLAIFSGGWTLDDAERVCSDVALPTAEILDLLGRLIDKSLVQMAVSARESRYSMLETLRDYGHERLVRSADLETVRRRHLDHFLAMAESMDLALGGTWSQDGHRRLADAHANLATALHTAQDLDTDAFVRLAAALRTYWVADGRFAEGALWLSEAQRVCRTPDRTHGHVLRGLASIAHQQGDYRMAESLLCGAIGIFELLGDELTAARSLTNLGLVEYNRGEFALAAEHYRAALTVIRRHGKPEAIALALCNMGLCETDAGELEVGRRHLADGVAIMRERDDRRWLPALLVMYGLNAVIRGDHTAAADLLAQALRSPVHDPMVVIDGLGAAALLAASLGEPVVAVRLSAAAAAQRTRLDASAPPVSRDRWRRYIAPLQATLGSVWETTWAAGWQLSVDDAVREALSLSESERSVSRV